MSDIHQAEEAADTVMVFAMCLAIVVLYIAGERLIFDPLSRLYRGRGVATTASHAA